MLPSQSELACPAPGRLLSTNAELGQVILSFDTPLPATAPASSPSAYATPLGGFNASFVDDGEAHLPELVLHFQYQVAPGLDGLYTSM
jgi:hypothetical protein